MVAPYPFERRARRVKARFRDALELVRGDRFDGARLIEPDVLVELVGQDRVEIVAGELSLRPIDHADGALEPRRHQLAT